MSRTPEDILKAIYYDPKTGHTGAQQLYLRAQKPAADAGVRITLAKVQSWLKEQAIHQAFAPNGLDKPANWFRITDVPNSYVVDTILEEKYKANNRGYRGFLLFVELTSRKAFAYPFKSGSEMSPPTGKEALDIFKRFETERMEEKHPVARISGDQGKELTNKGVVDFLRSKHVQTYFHRAEDHYANGVLNAVARYIRRILERDLEHSNTVKWVDALDDAVANWNEHRILHLKASPDEIADNVRKQNDVREEALAHNQAVWAKSHVKEGDVVKTYLRRNTKAKGKWEKEGATFAGQYKVGSRQGYSFRLETAAGGDLPTRWRPYELREVPNPQAFQEEREAALHPRVEATQKARVERRVRQAVGKGAAERIVRKKRVPKPKVVAEVPEAPVRTRTRVAAAAKVKAKKGELVREVEYVMRHRRDPKGKLEFKVKWKHLSAAESLALPFQPLESFVETVNGVRYFNPAIDKYMTKHVLEE